MTKNDLADLDLFIATCSKNYLTLSQVHPPPDPAQAGHGACKYLHDK